VARVASALQTTSVNQAAPDLGAEFDAKKTADRLYLLAVFLWGDDIEYCKIWFD
jgi:hypothetical protein